MSHASDCLLASLRSNKPLLDSPCLCFSVKNAAFMAAVSNCSRAYPTTSSHSIHRSAVEWLILRMFQQLPAGHTCLNIISLGLWLKGDRFIADCALLTDSSSASLTIAGSLRFDFSIERNTIHRSPGTIIHTTQKNYLAFPEILDTKYKKPRKCGASCIYISSH